MRYGTKNIDLTNKGISDIFACGDIHGEFSGFINEIKTRKFDNCFIIVCGDIGMGFYKDNYYLNVFNDIHKDLVKLNIYLLLYRGNHDDPSWFTFKNYESSFDVDYPNIILLDDYSIVNFPNNINAVFIGGARSIDKYYRILNGWKHWDNENIKLLNDNDLQRCINKNINYVFTHTTCNYLDIANGKLPQNIIDNYIALGDKTLVEDIAAERIKMNEIYNSLSEKLNIKEWICGHFHTHAETIYNDTHFVCLDMYRDDIHRYNHNILETREHMKRGTKSDWYRIN